MRYPVYDLTGAEQVGEVDLDERVFAVDGIRGDILHRMVCYQLARRRSGTRRTQTRSEVSVRHGKSYAQKRTGRARAGSRNSPLFVGGAVAHGPRVRSHATRLPKKVRAMAMRHALSSRCLGGELTVVSDLRSESGRTSVLSRSMAALGLEHSLVIGRASDEFQRAVSNLATVEVSPVAGLNVYDVLRCRRLVLTVEAVSSVQRRLGMSSATGVG